MPTKSDKNIIKEMEEYLEAAHKSGRASTKASNIGTSYLRERTYNYVLLFIKLGCKFIKKATSWEDLSKRHVAVFDPFQFSEAGSSVWFYPNKDIIKTIAEMIIKLIKKLGIPKGYDKRKFDSLLGPVGISPTKIEVTGTKGWIFKRKVTEEVPKTKKEILLELEAKVASL